MHILITIHDITIAEQTLCFAAQFAGFTGQETTVLAITEGPDAPSQLNDILNRAGEILGPVQLSKRLRAGDLYQEVIAEAKAIACDLLIIGESEAQRSYAFWPRQDTIHKLVERASCPVIVVKGPARGIKRILLCDSGAENSVLSRFTVQVAELLEGEEDITVLHVMSQISAGPGVPDAQLRAGAKELIQDAAPEGKLLMKDIELLGRPGIHPLAKIRHGLVVDEIITEARSGDYDLVVIGAHREQGWQRFLLDDLAHKILTQIDRPVLVVR